MSTMDHATFHDLELDALYDELDAPGARALQEHAASCETCGPRFERLQNTRARGLAALRETVSDDFESRVMIAVDAVVAEAARRGRVGASGAPSPGPALRLVDTAPAPTPSRGKVIPFFARPSFAVAATVLLLLGAGALLSRKSMSDRASAVASKNDETPAAASPPVATATAATVALGEPMGAASASPDPAAPPPPPAVDVVGALATRDAPADPANGPLALNQAAKASPAHARNARPVAPGNNEGDPMTAAPMAAPPPAAAAQGDASLGASFTAAKALYDQGRYTEALPRFEQLKGPLPEAELYAARCVQQISGCASAIPRFDLAAQRNSGATATRARAEGNRCRNEGSVQARPAATSSAGPGTPGAGRPAAKSAAPLEDVAPSNDSAK